MHTHTHCCPNVIKPTALQQQDRDEKRSIRFSSFIKLCLIFMPLCVCAEGRSLLCQEMELHRFEEETGAAGTSSSGRRHKEANPPWNSVSERGNIIVHWSCSCSPLLGSPLQCTCAWAHRHTHRHRNQQAGLLRKRAVRKMVPYITNYA